MFAKKIWILMFLLLSACAGNNDANWGDSWSDGEVQNPAEITANATTDTAPVIDATPTTDVSKIKTVSVLLPLSGANGDLGTGIQHSIEIAFFQKQPKNIMVSFMDLSGTDDDKNKIIDTVIANKPDLIIGPLFADDAALLKAKKPVELPAITFTSAKQVLGNGIFTLGLLPNQAVESIIKQIKSEDKKHLVIIVPDSSTGYMLGNSAIEAAKEYGMNVTGLYLFNEGDQTDIKDLAQNISLYDSRVQNLNKTKEILSNILINEILVPADKDLVRSQLDEMNKKDSLGDVPYDAVLFLGNAMDSKTMGSYLRFYDVYGAKTTFYGSALWDTDIVYKDSSLAGGEYASLPRIPVDFDKLYSEIEGYKPNRFNTIGYDAAMLAIKALSGEKPVGAYLLDPSGYVGLDGLVRLKPNGENERSLQIMQLNGVRLPLIKKSAEGNFVNGIYKTNYYSLEKPDGIKLTSEGYNPMDFIKLPESLNGKYTADTIGIIYDDTVEQKLPGADDPEHVEDVPEDTETVKDDDFKPVKLDPVDKKLIESVEMKSNED